MNNKKGGLQITILIIVILLIIGGGIFAYQYFTSPIDKMTDINTTSQTASWKTYTNTQYGFQFQYPANEEVKMTSMPESTAKFSVTVPAGKIGQLSTNESVTIVGPIENSQYKTADEAYAGYLKSSKQNGSVVQKFNIGDDKGVLFYLSVPGVGAQCIVGIIVFHGDYFFSMPASFGPIFAPQTRIGDCIKNSALDTASSEYKQILSTFKFTS